MTDPFADDVAGPSQPAPAPAKRSMFKNRQRGVVAKAEPKGAIDFFSRSREIFPESVRIKKEEREREKEREREEARKREREKSLKLEEGRRGRDGEVVDRDEDEHEERARKKNKRYVGFAGRGDWKANRPEVNRAP
jgi:hypothetical protein